MAEKARGRPVGKDPNTGEALYPDFPLTTRIDDPNKPAAAGDDGVLASLVPPSKSPVKNSLPQNSPPPPPP